MLKGGNKPANGRRASELRRTGLTWSEVGEVLAQEEGRPIRYTPRAMMGAVEKYRETRLREG